MQLKSALMLLAVCLPLQSAVAATATEPAQGPMGLRMGNIQISAAETGVTVDASISRSRLTRVLTPVQLQINLVNTDGSIAATAIKTISAADLRRRNSRDVHVKFAFGAVPQAGNYTIAALWL